VTLNSLLYVSTSQLAPEGADDEVLAIVRAAELRNASLELTGALLFSGTHFVQVLEGADEEVDVLLSSLQRDSRHRNLTVIVREPIASRRFADWRMAYSGPSQFVARHVTRVLNEKSPADRERASNWLLKLLREFAVT
jgi:hypothetical protein